jgi:hypothetical protein
MTDTKDCLVYPTLQKFYNALSNLESINPNNYIFEIIPNIDAFFQEFRNITFVMQKSFNTSELKAFYETKREAYLISDEMKWFDNARVETVHRNPFMLEKAISLKTYVAADNFDELKTLLTIDRDKNFADLLSEVSSILEERYRNWFEVFFSISVLFIENGKEIDIFEKIIEGTKVMWNFVSDVCNDYPCSCDKCNNLKTKIVKALNKIQFNKAMRFTQDCYYNAGKIQTGNLINFSLRIEDKVYNKNDMRFDLAENPVFEKECCDNDIRLLQKWASNHIVTAKMQLELTKKNEPMIYADFLLVYEDNTAEMVGFFGGTVKTTYYRIINEVAKRANNEKIRAVLYVCEFVHYPLDKFRSFCIKSADERQNEASGTCLYSLIASKQLEDIIGIGIDYSKINDNDYLSNQIINPENLGKNFMIGPIYRALKSI